MIDINRKSPRFSIKFTLSTNLIEGYGVNISQKGFGFLTRDEMIPAEGIPFETVIKGYIFSNKEYELSGVGRLIYSGIDKENTESFYNGFEFITLTPQSQENLFELLDDIRKFYKSIESGISNKTLSDYMYFSSNDMFYKTEIFYDAIKSLINTKYEMFSYYLDSGSRSSSYFIKRNSQTSLKMVMMGSNNYLGLTTHPDVITAGIDALKKYGSGNGSGAMVGGTFSIHKQLEEALAEFTGKEDVIIYSSGYGANVGIISGLARPNDVIINDQFNHASVFDGCKLSNAKTLIYAHNDMDNLNRILNRSKLKYSGQLIVVNGVFSTNGELAPLDIIVNTAKKYKCRIMVDEAHGLGVLGKKGIGASEYFNVLDDVDIIMGTMSKSLGGVGGFAASTKEVIEYLRYYARSYLFSTNIPPSTAATILKSLQIMQSDNSIRESLKSNISFFKKKLQGLNINIGNTVGAILPLYIQDIQLLGDVSKYLFDNGVYHNVMSYPAVPMGGSLLRFGVMATHSEKELTYAADMIEKACKAYGIIN